MAEKEERISVIVYEKDPCKNCPGNPMTDCQVCEKDLRYDGGMTRQEAIEKIKKHLKASTIKFSTTPDVVAEIALNALLEVQNER